MNTQSSSDSSKKISKSQNNTQVNTNTKDLFLSTQQKKLPPNFADELLNLELDMESEEVAIQKVNKLLQLYATAVEYYESIQNDRYLIFQNKTQALLLQPSIMKSMNIAHLKEKEKKILNQQKEQNSDQKNEKVNKFDEMKVIGKSQFEMEENQSNQKFSATKSRVVDFNQAPGQNNQPTVNSLSQSISTQTSTTENTENSEFHIQQKQKNIQLNLQFIASNTQDTKDSARKLLDSHNVKVERNLKIIQKDFEIQEQNLQKRLQYRRKMKGIDVGAGEPDMDDYYNQKLATEGDEESESNEKFMMSIGKPIPIEEQMERALSLQKDQEIETHDHRKHLYHRRNPSKKFESYSDDEEHGKTSSSQSHQQNNENQNDQYIINHSPVKETTIQKASQKRQKRNPDEQKTDQYTIPFEMPLYC